jgi:transposase
VRSAARQFLPEPKIKAMRDVVRYRKKLVGSRTSELQRLGAVLQDAGIKLDSVASSIGTVSGRAMIEALIDGERRPTVLVDLALGRMRSKIADLTLALEGRFDAHHAVMCQLQLEHIDHLDEMIARLDTQVEQMMVPFARQRDLLVTIPGIGPTAAAAILSEIGANSNEFFADGPHLASWAGRVVRGAHRRSLTRALSPSGAALRGLPQSRSQEEGRRRHRPHPAGDHLERPSQRHQLR